MRRFFMFLLTVMACFSCVGCNLGNSADSSSSDSEVELWEKDLTNYDVYGQETRIEYGFAWKPAQRDGYVGDPMPYYENGVYHIFYLKDEGGSLRHSVYRVDTTDFIHYEDKGLVLESRSIAYQDYWIGTGSVVKAGNDYYLFYTGHNPNKEDVWEKVMVAKSEGNMDNFVRVPDFEIAPPSQYNQRDFRDPQVFFNEETNSFDMTVETNRNGRARIAKFNISLDLKTVRHEGDLYVDEKYGFWNLECADIFEHNGKYYLTYSAQGNPMDTVWIAESDKMFGTYVNHRRIEGLHFYAAKTVTGADGTYLVGWLYRKQDTTNGISDDAAKYWGGHLVVHKIDFDSNGKAYLAPLAGYEDYYGYQDSLLSSESVTFAANQNARTKLAEGKESYMITGDFTYTGENKFGILLGYNDNYQRYISYYPREKKLAFSLKTRFTTEAEVPAELIEGQKYSFVYVQEGSVGIFYIKGVAGLSFRVYGINNKRIALYSDGSAVDFENLKYFLRVKQEA